MARIEDELLEEDLDEYLDIQIPVELIADPDDPDFETEVVLPAMDQEQADRILYRARRLTGERAAVGALADKRRAEIDRWEADRTGGIDAELARAERSLELFARQWQRANPRSKTLSLPNGQLSLRAPGRGKILVEDEHAFVAWAREHDRMDLLRVEYHPMKSALADVEEVDRHMGVQINDPETGELIQTFRLMVDVPAFETMPGHQPILESVSVPGVVYTERLQDRFTMVLTRDQAEEEG